MIGTVKPLIILGLSLTLGACAPEERARTGGTQAQNICAELKSQLTVPSGQRVLCQPGGVIIHSDLRRTPSVVAELLTTASLSGDQPRTDDFRPDPRLAPNVRAELSDYRRSGYDRGHLAPAADASSDAGAMSASFLLSNIAPQNPDLNREAWAGLESATRACATSQGQLTVLTGVSGSAGRIGRGVVVPATFYKIWISGQEARAWVMPNRDVGRLSGRQMSRYEVSPSDLQAISGYRAPLKQGRFCSGALPVPRS